jgi:hypothetical protein
MTEHCIECSDLAGKTIQTVRIYKDAGDGTEILIELTDGTSFSCNVSQSPTITASLYKGGSGSPEILTNYTSDPQTSTQLPRYSNLE